MQTKLHHLLHEYFMLASLRGIRLMEWRLLPWPSLPTGFLPDSQQCLALLLAKAVQGGGKETRVEN